MAYGFVVTVSGTRDLAQRLGALSDSGATLALRTATLAGAQIVVNAAQEAAPVRTGTLRRSIHSEVKVADRIHCEVEVGTDLDYGRMMEEGTRPHIIEPRTAGALWWPDALHPVRLVHHPGTAPRPFLVPALLKNEQKVSDEIVNTLNLLVLP